MIRIVVGITGPGGSEHDLSAVARALRDAGHEVVYAGEHQSPEQIVGTAIQEDADLIALAVLGADCLAPYRRLLALLADQDASDIAVVDVGVVAEQDVAVLQGMGVARLFAPGAPTSEIPAWVAEHFGADR